MHKKPSTRDRILKHIDRKLIMRMRIFAIIFLVTLIIAIVETVVYKAPIRFILGSFILGCLIGLFAGRIQKITFDHDAYKIISRMDRLGVVILILYIALAVLRKKLIGDRVHGPAVAIVTLGFVSGTMLGRTLAMRYAIRTVLKSIGII